AGVIGIVDEARKFVLGESVADGEAVDGNIVTQQRFDGVAVSVVVEGRAVGAVRYHQDDLAAGGAAIVKQLGGRMHRVVQGLGGPMTRVEGRGWRGLTNAWRVI